MLLFCLACFNSQATAQAMTPNFTEGSISRVLLIDIKPGKNSEFWTDLRQNGKPIFEAYKAAGIIEDYTIMLKTTSEGENDWDVSIIVRYKNYGALDGLAARTDPITLKHYGSSAARAAAGIKRNEFETTVGNFFVRHVNVNDMPR